MFRNYLLLIFTEFMVEKYAQEYEDFTKEWELQRKKEAAEKAERKKRLSFPGKYDVQLLRIMWRETRHQKKALFLICAGNSALFGVMLFLFAMKTTLGKGYGITDELPSQGWVEWNIIGCSLHGCPDLSFLSGDYHFLLY